MGVYNFKQPIFRIQINPKEDHLVTILGQNIIKNLRVQEGQIQIQADISKISQEQNFTDCCWFNEDTLIVCNDKGEIFIIYKNQLIQYIQNGFNQENVPIYSLQTFSLGFIVCSVYGKFAFWKQDEENGTNLKDQSIFVL